MSRYKELIHNKKFMSELYAVTLAAAVLILVSVIKGPEASGKLLVDAGGNVTGIERRSTEASESYDIRVEAGEGRETVTRDVTLVMQKTPEKGNISAHTEEENREAAVDAEIDRIINEIEYSNEKKVELPSELPDGTILRWSEGEHKAVPVTVIVIVIYATLVLLLATDAAKDKTAIEERRSILRGLPRFCNQLFLMMNAGLILSDAFDTITESYSGNKDGLSMFEKDLAELRDATCGHRISTAHVLREFAVRHDVKEMIRISAILSENEKRGSDVIESLARESRYLWDERKIIARECGKAIDAKMSYPLGLLLILLIVITIAPALLNM